jgi:hypothetical protein
MPQEAQAFARTLIWPTNANVIERAESKPVSREGTAADFAWNLMDCVVRRALALA